MRLPPWTNPIGSTRATGWRAYSLPPANGVRILPTERRRVGRNGGCNYIAGGCGPIARTLGLPNWSIKKETHVVIRGGSVLDIRPHPRPRENRHSLSTAGNYYPSSVASDQLPPMSFPSISLSLSLSPRWTRLAELVYVFEMESKVIISVEEWNVVENRNACIACN